MCFISICCALLFEECYYSIQIIQVIASYEQLIEPMYLCLDRHLNIIATASYAHNIKVFSLEGNLVANEPGQSHCLEIYICRKGCILVTVVVVERKFLQCYESYTFVFE